VSFRFPLFLLLATLVWVVGCGTRGPKNSVSGKVTLNGKAVGGSVLFVGPDGKDYPTSIDHTGTYTLVDPPSGECKVAVRGTGKSAMPAVESAGVGSMAPPPGVKQIEEGVPPPSKYASPENGELKFTVTGGNQTYDIVLKE